MNKTIHFTINNSKLKQLFLVTLCLFTQLIIAQYKIPEKPKLQTSVYDYIGLLSKEQKKTLERKLIKYSDTTSTQIVVAIINSTKGEYINYLGTQWAHKWGIGQAKEDNGIFILLAKNDRKIGINTGQGIEHLLTDALSRRIIENDIIPHFKQGNYYAGLNSASDAIFKVMTGEYKGTRKSDSNSDIPGPLIFFIIFFFIILLISISNNKKGGGRGGYKRNVATDILETIILSNSGRGSYKRNSGSDWGGFGGGGSFGGGGFGGGFGGGGFGGGGASGGW